MRMPKTKKYGFKIFAAAKLETLSAWKMKVFSLLLLSWIYAGNCSKIFGGSFPNWAQDREVPYTFTPSNLLEIAERLDHLVYSHIHFDSINYSIVLTGERDKLFLQKLGNYRDSFPNFKLLVSIGGDEFPSSNFSAMARSNKTRSIFIENLQVFLKKNKLDGVEISWKWPCSSPKIVHKKPFISCESIEMLMDEGSKCPHDAFHFLALLREMRHKLKINTIITVSGSPFPEVVKKVPLGLFSKYIDYWYVETFGYALSATNNSQFTAPYAPLYDNSSSKFNGSNAYSIDNTVNAYLEAGVPSRKIVIGIPLHGNFWYVPNIMGNDWHKFGIQATIQGDCCSLYRLTFGAKGGPATNTCGMYMYSEILAVQDAELYYDKATQTALGYLKQDSMDGWTKGGTWFSYSDKNSIKAVTQYINDMGLAGAFVSDISEDSIDFSSKEFTYELMNAVYYGLQGGGGGNQSICNPFIGCNVCSTCCRTYLTNKFDCNACVAIKCTTRICYPPTECNVCSDCCSSFTCSQMQCNYCVKNKCKNDFLV